LSSVQRDAGPVTVSAPSTPSALNTGADNALTPGPFLAYSGPTPCSRVSRRDGQPDEGRAVRGNNPLAGKDLAHVVKHNHAVAQQAPSLLGVTGDSAGGIAVPVIGWRARGSV
jgi:hypothetical protein